MHGTSTLYLTCYFFPLPALHKGGHVISSTDLEKQMMLEVCAHLSLLAGHTGCHVIYLLGMMILLVLFSCLAERTGDLVTSLSWCVVLFAAWVPPLHYSPPVVRTRRPGQTEVGHSLPNMALISRDV